MSGRNDTIEAQAQNMADSLNMSVWISADRKRITQHATVGGTEVQPRPGSGPAPHGSPIDAPGTGG